MICILFLFLCQTVSSHFHLLRVGAGCSTLQFPENYLYSFKFAIFLPTNFSEEPKIKKSVASNSKKAPAGQATGATDKAGKSWVLEQNGNHFTLQLAVFSTSKAARNFIDQESLNGLIASHPVYKDERVLYAVLYGSYRNRSEADNAKRSLGHLKPWIRQFKELHR